MKATKCGVSCGCGARCPRPAGHPGRFWDESPTMVHSHGPMPNERRGRLRIHTRVLYVILGFAVLLGVGFAVDVWI